MDIDTQTTAMEVVEESPTAVMATEGMLRKGRRNVISRVGGGRGGTEVDIIMVLEVEGVGEVVVVDVQGMVGLGGVILRGRCW